MADEDISDHIEALVKEEHELLDRGGSDWDLLRQRRARRRAGQDPEGASPRDADTVEHYLQ
jgi:Protein of unknown function (DUF2630)